VVGLKARKTSPSKKSKAIDRLASKLAPVFRQFGVTRASIFGSWARGEQKKCSDVDLLVEIPGSLLDVARLELAAEKRLRKSVDVLTYGGIDPLLKNRILGEEVRII